MTIEIKVPALGESVSEASIAKIYKKIGEAVKADELIFELETDKVTLEVNAPSNGNISQLKVNEGDSVKVGYILAIMSQGSSAVVEQAKPAILDDKIAIVSNNNASFLSPAPKKIIAENNLDASKINGTGKDGRITKGDALSSISNSVISNSVVDNSTPVVAEKLTERVKMSRLRQKVAERLKESQNTAAILTTFNEVDMSAVMALRSEHKDVFEKKHNSKLGFMSFFVKATVTALKEIPAVNA